MLDPAGLREVLRELVLIDGDQRAVAIERIARDEVVPWSSAIT